MQELLDIIGLVNSELVFPIKKFSEEELDGTKLYQLYEGIANSTYTDDEAAALALYGTDASDKRYLMLRKNLIDRLVLTMVQYDYSKRCPPRVNERSWCMRALFASNVLLTLGAIESATRLTEKILRRAEQFQFTEIRVQCLQILRGKIYLQGDLDRYEEHDRALKDMLALQQAELEAEEMCQRIEIHLVRSSAEQPHLADQAETFLRRLKVVQKKHSSFDLDVNVFRINLLMLQIRHEYKAALRVCREADAYCRKYPDFGSKKRRAEFVVAAMNCCLYLRDYEQALDYGSQCSDLFVQGKYNWYMTQGINLLLACHTGDFVRALSIFNGAMSHRGFEILPDLQREKWLVYGAYLNIAVERGWLQHSGLADKRRFNKIIRALDPWQNLAAAARDKKGLRITVLLLEIVSLVEMRDESGILTRLKLLQRNIRKHRGDEEYERTMEFIHMLRTLIRARFNTSAAWKKAAPHYNALLSLPRSSSRERFVEGVEIIPYERLWEWLVYGEKKRVATE